MRGLLSKALDMHALISRNPVGLEGRLSIFYDENHQPKLEEKEQNPALSVTFTNHDENALNNLLNT